jgi:hypothetical protein
MQPAAAEEKTDGSGDHTVTGGRNCRLEIGHGIASDTRVKIANRDNQPGAGPGLARNDRAAR